MPVFFNGRLWITPATMSKVDDSALFNKNLSVGNVLALVGRSEGGKPGAELRFGTPDDAIATLKSGELLTAVLKAFDPSAQTGGPVEIVAIRVNPATQSSLNLLDAQGGTAISLLTTDFGLYTSQIKVKIETGTLAGKKVTTSFGNDFYTVDDLTREALSVQYTGLAASATITVSDGTVVLAAPAGTNVATIDLGTYPTIQQLVDRINVETGFFASVLDGNESKPAFKGLDAVVAADVKTEPYIVKADLQAVVDWINSEAEGVITATRGTLGLPPANIPFTYLTGGSNGIVTNESWQDAFSVLQEIDVQWLVPISSSASIHAMADTHAAFMSNVGRKERRAICGTASGTDDLTAIAAAKALNSDRTSLVHLGYYDFNAAGDLVLMEPYFTAAAIAGAFAGVNPGTPMTNKTLKVRGLERNLRNPVDTDRLIKGGVLCVENTEQGFKVVKSITTWLVNQNYNRVEISTGVALDFVARNVRNALDVLRGEKGSPITIARAVSIAESTLRELARAEPQGPGVIVGDDASPAFKGITATLEGDVLRVQFQCSPVIPVNYIPVTIFAVPYTGTATAA